MTGPDREQVRADLHRSYLLLGLVVMVLGGAAAFLVQARATSQQHGYERTTRFHMGTITHCRQVFQHLLEMELSLADEPELDPRGDDEGRTSLILAGKQLQGIRELQSIYALTAVEPATRRLERAHKQLSVYYAQRSTRPSERARRALRLMKLRAEQLRRLHEAELREFDAVLQRQTERWLWKLGGLAGLMLLVGAIVLWRILDRSDRAVDSWQRAEREGTQLTHALDAGVSEAYLLAPESLRVEYASRGAGAALGVEREKLEGMSLAEFAPELDLAAVRDVAIGTRGPLTVETRHRRSDGSDYPVQLSLQRIEQDDGSRLLAVAMDVSDLHDARVALHQAQKVEAAGQVAGGLAHDFNNLIMVIEGHAELLRLQRSTPALRAISEASARAGALTKQLLQFSRKSIVQPVVLDLNRMLADVRYLLERLINANIKTRYETPGEPVTVKADRGQIQQVILNLCINAQDAMPEGGELTLSTGWAHRGGDAAPTWKVDVEGDFAFLRVADTGHGMDEDTRRRAFEPFFTTKPVGRGTGLGLASVHSIITECGGHVHVESEVEAGSRFTVYLPRSAEQPPEHHRVSEDPSDGRGEEMILVVDDDELVADLIEDVLQRKGYRVLLASTPSAALAHVAKHGDELQLLITDLVMPEMTGYELADRVMASHPGIGVIYISGYAPDRLVPERRLDKDITFLQKPFPPRDLVRAVRRVLDAGHPGRDEG